MTLNQPLNLLLVPPSLLNLLRLQELHGLLKLTYAPLLHLQLFFSSSSQLLVAYCRELRFCLHALEESGWFLGGKSLEAG